MKFVLKTLAIGALAGLVLAGCASATSNSAPSYDSAPQASQEKGLVAINAMASGAAVAKLSGSSAGITYTGSLSGSGFDFTITFDGYDNGQGDTITGTVRVVSSTSGSTVTGTETADLTITGIHAGKVAFDLGITEDLNASTIAITGDITIDGTKYSYNFSGSLTASVEGSPVAPSLLKALK